MAQSPPACYNDCAKRNPGRKRFSCRKEIPMTPEIISLSSEPMPYMTDCDLKRFGAFEYHCSRCCDYFVLIFMLGSCLKFTEDSRLTTLSAGEWYIQKKSLRQSAPLPSPNAEYYWIHFRADYADDPMSSIRLPIRVSFRPELAVTMLEELHSACQRSPRNPFELQSGFYRLLDLIYAHENACSPLTASVISYLNGHYREPVTSRTLAAHFHYSAEYINKRLKEEMGTTIHACLAKLRLQRASRLLVYSDRPVQEIARECGFSDVSLLYKAFRRAFGLSPSQYRREHQVSFRPPQDNDT